MRKDKDLMNIAVEVVAEKNKGERMVIDAALRATEQMTRLAGKVKTPEARAAALQHHGLYMGIGTRFMETLAPKARSMQADLISEGCDEDEAAILTGFWLAKIFIELNKEMNKHEQS